MPRQPFLLFLLLAFVLAGTGTADAATPAPLSLRTARFVITNDSGGPIALTKQIVDSGDSWRETPGDIADGSVGDYTLMGSNRDIGAILDYALPGDYVLQIHGENPLAAPNSWDCSIEHEHLNLPSPPFACTVRQVKKGYNDTNFYVTVTRVVPTLRTARFLIADNAGGPIGLKSQSVYSPHDVWRDAPGDIGDGDVGDFTVTANGDSTVGASLTYTLPGSQYDLVIDANSAFLLPDNASCGVMKSNSIADRPALATPTPYKCSITVDRADWNDMNVGVTVARA